METSAKAQPIQAPEKMSYEEFLAWCDEDTWAEWVDGEVVVIAPASDLHQDLADFLIAILRIFVETWRLGWVRSAPFQMRLARLSRGREPDILFVRQERIGLVQQTYLVQVCLLRGGPPSSLSVLFGPSLSTPRSVELV